MNNVSFETEVTHFILYTYTATVHCRFLYMLILQHDTFKQNLVLVKCSNLRYLASFSEFILKNTIVI